MRRASAAPLVTLVCLSCIAPPPIPPAPPVAGSTTPAAVGASSSVRCDWPNGAKAAVSLSYDDALASQLAHAVPALDKLGLKATFFLSGGNMSPFAPLAQAGHELGSHTITHPCNADLSRLSLAEMAAELDAGDAAVRALGVTGKLTFAYPCGQQRVASSQSYVPLVRERFRGARGVSAAVADAGNVDLFNVPALFPPTSSDGGDVVAFVERAVQTGGWAVIGMHGVTEAGEYLQLSQAAHDKVLQYLADNRGSVWTAPFGTVVDAVQACRSAAPQ